MQTTTGHNVPSNDARRKTNRTRKTNTKSRTNKTLPNRKQKRGEK